jgi:hypothetical protein
MSLSPWYKTVLLVWLCMGVPSLVLAYGFSGGDIKSWFDLEGIYESDLVVLLIVLAFLICPLWLAPFGIHRKTNT